MSEFLAYAHDHLGLVVLIAFLLYYGAHLTIGAVTVALCLFWSKLDEIAQLLKSKKRIAANALPVSDSDVIQSKPAVADGARS
ncbi:MAG TPA: hypothetical protein VKE98_20765 [Gemmataceae bacterium]|nr:hypothetical protein [Gemmataceae bacterium]